MPRPFSIRQLFWLTLVIACLMGATSRTSRAADAIDDYVHAQMKAQKIAGLSLAVVKNGKVVRASGYGKANLEWNVPASPQTVYQMGSVAKQFTAAGVLLLAQDGKIGLDDSIRKYLPDAPDAWQPVTVRNLLNHTSGLGEYSDLSRFDLRRDTTYAAFLKGLYTLPSDFAPGEKWAYCNTNYALLGYVIEKASGKFYGDFLQARVFKPLGMTQTRIISERDLVMNRAAGYERTQSGAWKNQAYVGATYNTLGDGGLYTTVLDMAKWDAALYGDRLLSATSRTEMWTPAPLKSGTTAPYGFGWALGKTAQGKRIVEHSGAWQGFTASITRYLDDKVTVIALCNTAGANPVRIAHKVAGIYEPFLAASPAAPITDTQPQVTALLKKVYESLADGTLSAESFSPEFWRLVEPQHAGLQASVKALGPVQTVQLVSGGGQGSASRYRITFKNGMSLLVTIALDKAGKIAGLRQEADE